jgi:transposase
MIEERGCKLEFLPPYSPDFNPIEYSFSAIKRALRGPHKYRLKGDETLQELANKVLRVAKEVVTPEMARNQYRHCNIQVDYN